MRGKRIGFVVMVLILAACKGQQEQTAGVEDAPKKTENLGPIECLSILKEDELDDEREWTEVQIMDYELVNNCVCITYQYSGCREGEARMIWSGKWDKSNRPRVMMKLQVEDVGLCEQLLEGSGCYGMKEMKLVGNDVLVSFNQKENNVLLDFNY